MNLKKLPLICNDLCILGSWPVSRSKRNKKLSMNRGVVSVAQTALSAVSQVGNLRAWLDPDASLVFTSADCQSAIRQTPSRLPVCATTLAVHGPWASPADLETFHEPDCQYWFSTVSDVEVNSWSS